MKSFLKYIWPSILWAAFILYACLTPSGSLPRVTIPHLDKLVHFTFYVVLVGLLFWGWQKQSAYVWLHKNMVLKILVAACTYGLMIEVMQEIFTTTRHFDMLDELTNATGAVAGSLISVKLFK
jgi:VanZ family protein